MDRPQAVRPWLPSKRPIDMALEDLGYVAASQERLFDYFAVIQTRFSPPRPASPSTTTEKHDAAATSSRRSAAAAAAAASLVPQSPIWRLPPIQAYVQYRFPASDYADAEFPAELARFCTPDGLVLVRHTPTPAQPKPRSTCFSFALTSYEGHISTAVCLTLWEPVTSEFLARATASSSSTSPFPSPRASRKAKAASGAVPPLYRSTNHHGTSSPSPHNGGTPVDDATASTDSKWFAPVFLCLISRHAIMRTIRRVLVHLSAVIHQHHSSLLLNSSSISSSSTAAPGDSIVPLERVISHFMLNVPLPTRGGPSVVFPIGNRFVSIRRPPYQLLPALELSPRRIFDAIDTALLLKIFTAIATEMKVVLSSRSFSLLHETAQVMIALLHPLRLQSVFIPVFPHMLMDFYDVVSAPCPFVIGVRSDTADISWIDGTDAILFDLDHSLMLRSSEMADGRPADSTTVVPSLPEAPMFLLLDRLRQALHPDVFHLDSVHDDDDDGNGAPTIPSGANARRQRPTDAEANIAIRAAFLEFWATLFASYHNHLYLMRMHPRPLVVFKGDLAATQLPPLSLPHPDTVPTSNGTLLASSSASNSGSSNGVPPPSSSPSSSSRQSHPSTPSAGVSSASLSSSSTPASPAISTTVSNITVAGAVAPTPSNQCVERIIRSQHFAIFLQEHAVPIANVFDDAMEAVRMQQAESVYDYVLSLYRRKGTSDIVDDYDGSAGLAGTSTSASSDVDTHIVGAPDLSDIDAERLSAYTATHRAHQSLVSTPTSDTLCPPHPSDNNNNNTNTNNNYISSSSSSNSSSSNDERPPATLFVPLDHAYDLPASVTGSSTPVALPHAPCPFLESDGLSDAFEAKVENNSVIAAILATIFSDYDIFITPDSEPIYDDIFRDEGARWFFANALRKYKDFERLNESHFDCLVKLCSMALRNCTATYNYRSVVLLLPSLFLFHCVRYGTRTEMLYECVCNHFVWRQFDVWLSTVYLFTRSLRASALFPDESMAQHMLAYSQTMTPAERDAAVATERAVIVEALTITANKMRFMRQPRDAIRAFLYRVCILLELHESTVTLILTAIFSRRTASSSTTTAANGATADASSSSTATSEATSSAPDSGSSTPSMAATTASSPLPASSSSSSSSTSALPPLVTAAPDLVLPDRTESDGDTLDANLRVLDMSVPLSARLTFSGNLRLVLLRAQVSRKSAGRRKPSTYCSVSADGRALFRTKAHPSSLEPEWRHTADIQLKHAAELEVSLYQDNVIATYLLGKASVSFEHLSTSTEHTLWLTLPDESSILMSLELTSEFE